MIRGVDVSGWQGAINWERAAAEGERFVIVKATQGARSTSKGLTRHLPPARAAGLVVGAYHFADLRRPEYRDNPQRQARHFLEQADKVGALAPGCLPPTLDLEWQAYPDKAARAADIGPRSIGFPARAVIDWALAFVEVVERNVGSPPMLYTGHSFWRHRLHRTAELNRCPLWQASYTWASKHAGEPSLDDAPTSMVSAPSITDDAAGWPRVTLWQWTGSGRVPWYGGKIDRNLFRGTEDAFQALLLPTGSELC